MDLKVVSVIVCLCALAIAFSEAGIPKCCITTKRKINPRVLLKVQRWEVQQNNGACDINALLLYVKNRRTPICAHPKVKDVLKHSQKPLTRGRETTTPTTTEEVGRISHLGQHWAS
ncbi:C-C motif chemokine 27a [Enoplosus armatus]|uniref:C-C motif chemokine 27a n=1 Tax=Enoplosus armatus TaxID=215367 RepID=UPI0039929B6D